jgi:hypothetical protein
MNPFKQLSNYLLGCLNNGWFYVCLIILTLNFFYFFKGGLSYSCKAYTRIEPILELVKFGGK